MFGDLLRMVARQECNAHLADEAILTNRVVTSTGLSFD